MCGRWAAHSICCDETWTVVSFDSASTCEPKRSVRYSKGCVSGGHRKDGVHCTRLRCEVSGRHHLSTVFCRGTFCARLFTVNSSVATIGTGLGNVYHGFYASLCYQNTLGVIAHPKSFSFGDNRAKCSIAGLSDGFVLRSLRCSMALQENILFV